MLAGRDEDLGAGDRIGAIAIGHGLGADHAEIGAAVRLGQVHRARPFAGDHLGHIGRLLFVRALGDDRRDRARGKAGIHRKGLIGGAGIFLEHEAEHVR